MVLARSDRIPRVPPYSGFSLLLNRFVYGAFTLSRCAFQHSSTTFLDGLWSPSPRKYYYSRFRLFRFRSPLLSESLFYFLLLRVIRCFSSPGSLHITIYSLYDTITLLMVSSLIRISTDRCLFATPRSFSQLVTSFFGAMYQGILLYALCSLIFRLLLAIRRTLLYFLWLYSTLLLVNILSLFFVLTFLIQYLLVFLLFCLNVLYFISLLEIYICMYLSSIYAVVNLHSIATAIVAFFNALWNQ